MLHDAVDLFALVVALVGLYPLFADNNKRKKALGITLGCMLLAGIGYICKEVMDQRAQVAEDEQTLQRAEEAIIVAACKHPDGMNFDDIYQNIDLGTQSWSVTDEAFGDLVATHRLQLDVKLIPSWDDKRRQVPLRVWSVSNRSYCTK